MMTLRDLERLHPSQLLGKDQYPSEGPARPEDKSVYLDHPVVSTEVLLSHGTKRVWLELWTVVGAQALVLAGPEDWLPEGTHWFCRHDEDLIDVVMVKMDENWEWISSPGATATAYAIPPIELTVGALLVAGLFLRPALVVGTLLLCQLTFGSALTQQWDIAGIQLVYVAIYTVLLATAGFDRYSIDRLFQKPTLDSAP
jgi:uncharacterized membrane protein YphA (DoxX/SURF4 family)